MFSLQGAVTDGRDESERGDLLMRRCVAAAVTIGALAAAPSASAGITEYAQTALNIIPSGQYGSLAPPPGADTQAKMYDGLTPLFDNVTDGDLTTYFKSEKFGVDTAGPGTNEPNPCGATITRDSYDVPHVDAASHDQGVCAAGWIAEEDRGSLLLLARNDAYVAAIDAPGIDAVGLIASLKQFTPSQQTIDEVHKQRQVLLDEGKEGKAVVHDIDTFVSGMNAYIDANSPGTPHFTDTDIFALNALKDQFVGEGGGDEARRSQFLGGLEHRL